MTARQGRAFLPRRGQRGAAAVEVVLVAPVVLLTFLLLVQWAVKLQAERVADAAAREGAVAAAAWDGSAQAGQQAALEYLNELDPQMTGHTATASRGVASAQATVEGTVLSLLPGIDLHVSSTARAPVERFVG